MDAIYSFNDYRAYLKHRLSLMPKDGYGQSRKLAQHMNVHTTLVSQIFSGTKALTPDLAASCADFFGLNDMETDYLLALVDLDRAGTELLRRHARRRIHDIKTKATDLAHANPHVKNLSEEHRAVFYSSWLYAAARQLSAIGDGTTQTELSEKLQIPMTTAKRVLDFLLETSLCVEKKRRVCIGPARTFTSRESPWVKVYHRNWRDRASKSVEEIRESGFHYTGPLTISVEDAEKVRNMLVDIVKKIDKVVDPSPSETFRCLCIDWFDPL